jgi:hypothetical protein
MEAIIVLASLSMIALGVVIWLLYKQQQQALGNHGEVLKSFEAIMGAINALMMREEQLHSALTSEIDNTKSAIAQSHVEGVLKVEAEIQKNTSSLADGMSKIESHVNERFNQSNSILAEGILKVESEILNANNKIESLEKSLNEAVIL